MTEHCIPSRPALSTRLPRGTPMRPACAGRRRGRDGKECGLASSSVHTPFTDRSRPRGTIGPRGRERRDSDERTARPATEARVGDLRWGTGPRYGDDRVAVASGRVRWSVASAGKARIELRVGGAAGFTGALAGGDSQSGDGIFHGEVPSPSCEGSVDSCLIHTPASLTPTCPFKRGCRRSWKRRGATSFHPAAGGASGSCPPTCAETSAGTPRSREP
jgi:hypothetical protein